MTASAALRVERPNQVYERLRALIIRGRLAPGVRVVENDIAERLGVSRTPAREAILRLHRDGFLVATPTTRRTELAVAPLTRDDMRDLYLLMASLEGSAARSIGELAPGARRELVGSLQRVEADFERAAGERKVDYDRLFELHNAFHHQLIGECRRPRLLVLIETVRPQVERYEWVYAPLVGPDHADTFREHDAIIRAVRNGSADAAQLAVAANWEQSAERLGGVIEQVGSRGDW
jgi:DNA-binding GntR family transcriptional regulator